MKKDEGEHSCCWPQTGPLGAGEPLASGPVDELPTCAVAGSSFDVGTRREVAEGGGAFLFVDRPQNPASR